MGRLLQFLSLICLIVLLFGFVIMPGHQALWLASGGIEHQIVRAGLIMVIVVQMLTRPPRRMWFRLVAGSAASVALVWALQQTYSYNMMPLDILSILGASSAIVLAVIERRTISDAKPVLSIPGHRETVRNH